MKKKILQDRLKRLNKHKTTDVPNRPFLLLCVCEAGIKGVWTLPKSILLITYFFIWRCVEGVSCTAKILFSNKSNQPNYAYNTTYLILCMCSRKHLFQLKQMRTIYKNIFHIHLFLLR